LDHDFQAVISYHSYGQLVLYPWSYTSVPAPDKEHLSLLAEDMADLIYKVHGRVYTPQQGAELYPASGVTDDWFYGEMRTFCFTFELRPVGSPGFILPENQIIPTWEENKPAALFLINWTQRPETPIPDIKANGSDGPLTVSPGTNLIVKIALEPGRYAGLNADYWVPALTPFGWYSYVYPTGWEPGIRLCYQGPLADLAPFEVLKSSLFTGDYTIYFGVDHNADGMLDATWWDSVQVRVD
jgi:hypothetical protein